MVKINEKRNWKTKTDLCKVQIKAVESIRGGHKKQSKVEEICETR